MHPRYLLDLSHIRPTLLRVQGLKITLTQIDFRAIVQTCGNYYMFILLQMSLQHHACASLIGCVPSMLLSLYNEEEG